MTPEDARAYLAGLPPRVALRAARLVREMVDTTQTERRAVLHLTETQVANLPTIRPDVSADQETHDAFAVMSRVISALNGMAGAVHATGVEGESEADRDEAARISDEFGEQS